MLDVLGDGPIVGVGVLRRGGVVCGGSPWRGGRCVRCVFRLLLGVLLLVLPLLMCVLMLLLGILLRISLAAGTHIRLRELHIGRLRLRAYQHPRRGEAYSADVGGVDEDTLPLWLVNPASGESSESAEEEL